LVCLKGFGFITHYYAKESYRLLTYFCWVNAHKHYLIIQSDTVGSPGNQTNPPCTHLLEARNVELS